MGFHTPGNGSKNGGAWPKGRRRHPKSRTGRTLVKKLRLVGLFWREIEDATGISVRALRAYESGRLWPSAKRLQLLMNAVAKLRGPDL
jgi:transcriptional regulator with XRE-family HTH domain